jgi:DHA1 family multidrug resistance protein-like MFS transporter
VVLVAAGLIVLKFVQDDSRPSGQQVPRKDLLPNIRPIFASPTLIMLLLIAFTLQAANTIAEPMLSLFLKSLASDSRFIGSSIGIVLGAGAASTAIAAIIVGRYSYKIAYWRTLICCFGAGSLRTIPQSLVTNAVQLALFRAIASFFVGGSIPVLNAIIANSTEKEHQRSVYGFNSSVSAAGGALGPVIGTAFMFGVASVSTAYRRHRLKK